jgi:allantoin racemase
VITPVVPTDAIDVEATLRSIRNPTTEIENFFLDAGPASIETEADVELCLPGLLSMGERVAKVGWQALVINCMCDPGVRELRAQLAVPVFGPAETSMHAIAAAGGRFSVLDVVSDGREMVEAQIATYGLRSHYVSHRAIDVPVLQLFSEPARTSSALEVAALAALADGADTLLLGCTGLAELALLLRAALAARGLHPAVVEPLLTSVLVARTLLDARLPDASVGSQGT